MGDKHKDCPFPVSENVKKKSPVSHTEVLKCFVLDIDSDLLYYPPYSKMFHFRDYYEI